jgi:hypothetical protein
MSDPYALPTVGARLPHSATLLNSLLDGARADSDADSRPAGDASVLTDYYPHRVVFIRNTTQFQLPNDQPIPIGKPSGTSDFYNGQVVFPVVSYVDGWATFARPLKRLPPGCAGPAVILGWLGPGRRPARYIYGGWVWRRTQPQRAYGGTTFTGLTYVQAARQNYPRPGNSTWRDAWYSEDFGLSYNGPPEARFPGMESLGHRFIQPPYGTVLEFRNPVDQHGWWTPTVEFRASHNYASWGGTSNYFTAPAVQTFGGYPYGGAAQVWLEPICWQPAVIGFNATPNAYSGNFNFAPLVTGTTLNPNGGVPPRPIYQSYSLPINFSTKNVWQNGLVFGESHAIHRTVGITTGYYYRLSVSGGLPAGWNVSGVFPPEVRPLPGPELLQIFETDRDDAIRFDGSILSPGIGTGPNPTGSEAIGPAVFGPIGLTAEQAPKTQSSQFVRRVSVGIGYGSVIGTADPPSVGCSLAAAGDFASGPVTGSAALSAAAALSSSGTATSPGVSGSASLTAANATLSAAGSTGSFGGGGA